jgi:hypothetical protein
MTKPSEKRIGALAMTVSIENLFTVGEAGGLPCPPTALIHGIISYR